MSTSYERWKAYVRWSRWYSVEPPNESAEQARELIDMQDEVVKAPGSYVARWLRMLGVSGVLVKAAEQGLITKLECAADRCFCPDVVGGRGYFEPKPVDPSAPMGDWMPNADHYPQLKEDKGELTPDNVRLTHVLCNRVDYSIRTDRSFESDIERAESFRRTVIREGRDAFGTLFVPISERRALERLEQG